jgi:hypothetical protein
LEAKGDKVSPIYLIFDRDDKPSNLGSSPSVRVLQWERRCAENYLLDTDVIASLLADPEISKKPISSEGEVRRLMKNLAMDQLTAIAAREVYNSYDYQNASLRTEELRGRTLAELSALFFRRASTARASIPDEAESTWTGRFTEKVTARSSELQNVWDAKWQELCDGKKLLSDLHKSAGLRLSFDSLTERQ